MSSKIRIGTKGNFFYSISWILWKFSIYFCSPLVFLLKWRMTRRLFVRQQLTQFQNFNRLVPEWILALVKFRFSPFEFLQSHRETEPFCWPLPPIKYELHLYFHLGSQIFVPNSENCDAIVFNYKLRHSSWSALIIHFLLYSLIFNFQDLKIFSQKYSQTWVSAKIDLFDYFLSLIFFATEYTASPLIWYEFYQVVAVFVFYCYFLRQTFCCYLKNK